MPKPEFKGFEYKKPSEHEFLTAVKEFWFEAYHVAVYLKRGDLWSAKVRSSGIHDHFLLKMIEWNELSKLNWNTAIRPMGKWMQSWVSQDTWNALHQIFAHFNEQDSWSFLLNTIALFRKLSIETAKKLGFSYPQDIDKNFSDFIFNLQGKP